MRGIRVEERILSKMTPCAWKHRPSNVTVPLTARCSVTAVTGELSPGARTQCHYESLRPSSTPGTKWSIHGEQGRLKAASQPLPSRAAPVPAPLHWAEWPRQWDPASQSSQAS